MNKVFIASRRKKKETIEREFPDSRIIDVTSKAEHPWVKFSPFYPHGNIPIPYSNEQTSYSVEGLWQGLKVFENQDIDRSKFDVQNMKGIKRSVRRFGRVLGHRKGINGDELLSYLEARKQLYLPSYHFILENFLSAEIDQILDLLRTQDVVLLDYETNEDINNLRKPLSHASIIASYINRAL